MSIVAIDYETGVIAMLNPAGASWYNSYCLNCYFSCHMFCCTEKYSISAAEASVPMFILKSSASPILITMVVYSLLVEA